MKAVSDMSTLKLRPARFPGSKAHNSSARTLSAAAVALSWLASVPVSAAECRVVEEPLFGGIEPAIAVDAECIDPDYNSATLMIDSTEEKTLRLPDGTLLAYTEVRSHFPARRKPDELPAGINQSPTTASHRVVWRFPEKKYFRHRFFQQTYPLDFEMLNTVDARFAFETGGGFTVGLSPGSTDAGYRVPAAAAKLAKNYARKFYGTAQRIYGYMYGQSGGSVQTIGAAEATTGVWDGLVPAVIATDGLNVHSFQWGALYTLAIPEAKRKAIAEAAAPGSGQDIYAGLTGEERAVLNELLGAGFPRNVLETMPFSLAGAMLGMGSISKLDPDYLTDFWTRPGYAGATPPAFVKSALVDGVATIASITRDATGTPTAVVFEASSMPKFGSTGSDGVQFTVLAQDGVTPLANAQDAALSGKLEGMTFNLREGRNNASVLAALTVGAKVRADNRDVIALAFYPRHSILENGNPAYNQYRNADGSPKYLQRPPTPIAIPLLNNVRTAGGITQSGRLKTKTIVFENLSDGNSYPYVAGFYASQVNKALGARKAQAMFRLYYQENGFHGTFLDSLPGKTGTMTAATGGTLHQVLLDLADWAEKGISPRPSTRHAIDRMNQVVLPTSALARGGHQPAVTLTVNGGDRTEVQVNQPVTLMGRIEMPPGRGKIVQYDWYLGAPDEKFEPPIKLLNPKARISVRRIVGFPAAGEYVITLRVIGQREGEQDSTTPLFNIDRARVIVR